MMFTGFTKDNSGNKSQMRGSFTPHNTITAKNPPSFRHPIPNPNNQPYIFGNQQHSPNQDLFTPDLPNLQKQTSSPPSGTSVRLSDIGNSSSLFSYNPTPSFDFGERITSLSNDSPIPFVFGASVGKPKSSVAPQDKSKMVNERSPAKAAAFQAVASHDRPKQNEESSFPSNAPLSSVPQFGQPSLPQSPLHRPKPKESSVFIQPKSRPEHHREKDRSAHPHLQAFKDATHKVVDPLINRALGMNGPENKYAQPSGTALPTRAPVPRPDTYTTTKPAAKPTYGSMGNTYGGFQTVNAGQYIPQQRNNFVDLTMNTYPDYSRSEQYTYVDPAKAQEDLKALLEGAMNDTDDLPKTRSRKKRQDAESKGLLDKLKGLSVGDEKLAVTSDDEDEADDGTVEGIRVKLLPHQVEGLEWMTGRELGTGKKGARVPKGGILADDMGLGKTLQSVALILSNAKPTDDEILAKRKLPSGVEKCTLVVAPLALIRQWELEIRDKVESSHALKVCVHHGPQRTKRFADLKKYDVVITTYQILVSEFGNSSDSDNGLKVGCFGLHWYRVILDEAHTIKNRNAKATQACYALRSEYRWCLSGTPMQNNLDELQSLIKFLRITPFDNLKEWRDQIDRPMKNGQGDIAIKRLRLFLVILMKRRTKDILKKDGALNPGGKPTAAGSESTTGFKVTERKIEKVFAEFSSEERKFYERLEQRTDASIEQMMSGKVNYASALVMLLRLRQACNHPKLVGGKLGKDSEALGADSASSSSQKSKAAGDDIDGLADMFGGLGVGSKKCEVCQLELGKQATADGAIRCLDCEADLKDVMNKQKSRKEKKKKQNKSKRNEAKVPKPEPVSRKPRNRAIIEDSDDEDEEGSWVVPKNQRGSLTLGKAGGIKDENAEGGGEWLDSDADETFPDLQVLHQQGSQKGAVVSDISDDQLESDSDSESEVENEIFSSSDEEAQLATIVSSTKITHLLQILGKESAQHKFIVFSQFTSMLDLIEPFLRQKGFKFTRYDGKMRNDLREASLNRLRNDKNCRVLLCSLKCGSLGLNLTAATRVVILEPFWNPFVEEQAIDRVHRLTQKIDVIVYKITIKDSVEERILDLQEKKRELATQTIEGGQGGAGKLGMKEILQLFRRDAEHAPSQYGPPTQDLGPKPRILKDTFAISSADSSRESSVARERKSSPLAGSSDSGARKDDIYGRRW